MRLGCDSRRDAEEMARAISGWLRDDACVLPDDERDESLNHLAVFVESLSRIKRRTDPWRPD